MKRNLFVSALAVMLALLATSCRSYQTMVVEFDEAPEEYGGDRPRKLKYVPVNPEHEMNTAEEYEGSEKSDDIKSTKLYKVATSWIGTPYLYGGTTRKGIDCSAFVRAVYQEAFNKELVRPSANQFSVNCRKISKSELSAGDLVFFRTDGQKTSTPNHVGIYLSNNQFIHASSSKGVTIADLTQAYYVKCWLAGGRVKD